MSTSISVRIINAEGMPATGDNFHRGEGETKQKKNQKKNSTIVNEDGLTGTLVAWTENIECVI